MNFFPLFRSSFARSAGRASVVVALAWGSVTLGGCASVEANANRELFVQRAPLPTLVPSHDVMTIAQRQAAATEGDFALMGAGESMEPYYRAGTALVVHPTSYHMLRPGMAVVYAKRSGGYVAHMLMRKTERGWLVMGLNNPTPDGAFVTEKNLVGIIRHAFAAHDTAFEPVVANQIAAYRPQPIGAVARALVR